MGFLVSPGVEVQEIDLTNSIPALSTSIGAFAGHFNWGPGNQVVTLGSEKELATIYGKPTPDVAQSFFTAASFLKYSNTLRVSRAISASARNSCSDINSVPNQPIANLDEFESTGFTAPFLARYPGELGDSIEVQVGYGNFEGYSESLFPSNFDAPSEKSEFNENLTGGAAGFDEFHVLVIDKGGKFTGIVNSVLESFANLSLASNAKSSDGTTIYYKDVINATSAYIYAGSMPIQGADEEISVSSVGLFPVFHNTTADPILPRATVLGILEISAEESYNDSTPVSIGESTTYPSVQFLINWPDDILLGENASLTLTQSGEDNTVTVDSIQIDSDAGYVNFTIAYGSLATTLDIKVALAAYLDDIFTNENLITIQVDGVNVSITPSGIEQIRAASVKLNQTENTTQTYEFTGASLAPGYIPFALSGGISGTTDDSEIVAALDYFAGADLIDVNLVFAETILQGSSAYTGSPAQNIDEAIITLVNSRKDCIGFISAPLDLGTLRTDADKKAYVLNKFNDIGSSSYIVFDSTPVYTYNKYSDTYLWIPASGHMAGLCAYTDRISDTWFSPAGYNRGQILGTTKIAYNPKQADRDDLYKARINPIVTFPGQGTLLYGDKTGQAKSSAFDRINVRRLFITLEKTIATAAKYQLFELNDEFTRAMFINMVEPFLRDVKGRRGITDFLVVCDSTNNTGEIIDSNRFVADIYIKPARSINFITLNFIATRTGVEFNEIVGK
jgi:hypothetical protein